MAVVARPHRGVRRSGAQDDLAVVTRAVWMKQLAGMVASLQSHVDDQDKDQILPAEAKSRRTAFKPVFAMFWFGTKLAACYLRRAKIESDTAQRLHRKALFLEFAINDKLSG